MRSLAPGSMPFGTTCGSIAAPSPNDSAAPKARCRSCSEGMNLLPDRICLVRLGDEHIERRNIGVPFDQYRHVAEAPRGCGIERPDIGADMGAVRVDQDVTPTEAVAAVPGEMELPDCLDRYPVQELVGVERVVVRAHVDVIDV